MTEVQLFPPWRQAVDDANRLFDYGDVITHTWLLDSLELAPPETGTRETFRAYELKVLSDTDDFKSTLLAEHKKLLENVRGRGYRIVKPGEQTDYSMALLRQRVSRELRKASRALSNCNLTLMDDGERKQNADAKGKLAALASMANRQLQSSQLENLTFTRRDP